MLETTALQLSCPALSPQTVRTVIDYYWLPGSAQDSALVKVKTQEPDGCRPHYAP
jgi:hypothetical protein